MSKNLSYYIVMMNGKEEPQTSRLNEIILTENMNQLHRNGILLMFDLCCDITYVLKWLVV
jgi:hypothetical protein